MGSGQSGTLKDTDIGSLVVEDDVFVAGTYHLVPFDDRPSTVLTKKHTERASEMLHKLGAEVAQSDTDGGATDPEVWMRMSRLMMLLGVDRTVLSQGGLGHDGASSSSSGNDEASGSSGASGDDVDHSVSRIRLSLEGKKIKKKKKNRSTSSSDKRVASYRGTVIKLLDCARIAVLRSQGQDGTTWFCLGEVLAFLDRRQRHVYQTAQHQLNAGNAPQHASLRDTLQARPQPPSCTIYEVSYNAYDCFAKAWNERGVEAALERIVLMEGLRLLSAARSAAGGGRLLDGGATVQRATLSNARLPPIPHLREQRREVLEKINAALAQRRCQPSLWFLLSQLLQLRDDDGVGEEEEEGEGRSTDPQLLDAQEGPTQQKTSSQQSQTIAISYAGRAKCSNPVEAVDWIAALNNILECDPRDFIVWALAISVVWPDILGNPFKSHHREGGVEDDRDDAYLYAPLATLHVGPVDTTEGDGVKTALSMEAAVVCAMQQDSSYGSDNALELHVFSNIRGVVDDQQRNEVRHSLFGALGVLMERKVATVSGALMVTTLYLRELVALRQDHQQKMRRKNTTSGVGKKRREDSGSTDWLGAEAACDVLLSRYFSPLSNSATLSSFVSDGKPFDRGNNEIDLIVGVLQRWPKRAVLWRYLGVLLAREDEARYLEYFKTVAKGVKPTAVVSSNDSSAYGGGGGGGVRVRSRLKAAVAAAASESAGHRFKKKALLAVAFKGGSGDAPTTGSHVPHHHQQPKTPPPPDALLGGAGPSFSESGGGFFWRPAHVSVDHRTELTAMDCFVMALVQDEADPVSWFCAVQLLRRYDVDDTPPGDGRRPRSVHTQHFGVLDAMVCAQRCFDAAQRPSAWLGEGILRGGADVVSMRRMVVAYAAIRLGETAREDRLLVTTTSATSRRRHLPPSGTVAYVTMCQQEQRYFNVAADHLTALVAASSGDADVVDPMLLAHALVASLEAGVAAASHQSPTAADLPPLRTIVVRISDVLFAAPSAESDDGGLAWTSGLVHHIRRTFTCCEQMLAWSEETEPEGATTKKDEADAEEEDGEDTLGGGFALQRLLLMEASDAFMTSAIAMAETHAAEDDMALELVLRSSLSSVLPAADVLLSQHMDGTRPRDAWLGTFVENLRTRWLKELLWIREAKWGQTTSSPATPSSTNSNGGSAAATAYVLVFCSFLLYVHSTVGESVTWLTALLTRGQRERLWRLFVAHVPAEDAAHDVGILETIVRGIEAFDDATQTAASHVLSRYRQLGGLVELSITAAVVLCRLLRGTSAVVADQEFQALRQSFVAAGGASPVTTSLLIQELYNILMIGCFVSNAKFSPSALNNVSSWPEQLPWMRPAALEALVIRGYWSARLGNGPVAHQCVEDLLTWARGQQAAHGDEEGDASAPPSCSVVDDSNEGASRDPDEDVAEADNNELDVGEAAPPTPQSNEGATAASGSEDAVVSVAGFVDAVRLLLTLAGENPVPLPPSSSPHGQRSKTDVAAVACKSTNNSGLGDFVNPTYAWMPALSFMASALQRLTTDDWGDDAAATLQDLSTHVSVLSHSPGDSFLALKADMLSVMAWWISVQDSPPPIALRVKQAPSMLINAVGLLQHALDVCHHPRIVFCRSVLSVIHQRGEGSSRRRVLPLRWEDNDTLHGAWVLQLVCEVHPRVQQHPSIALEAWRTSSLAQLEACIVAQRDALQDCWRLIVEACPHVSVREALRAVQLLKASPAMRSELQDRLAAVPLAL